ncbi:MAG: response regulator [bacterium JZ-2024 1]
MEDETVVRKVLSRMLEKLGYTVTETSDGMEALRIFREETERGTPFDLVIVDLTVPGGMGGREALRHLRELNPNVRVIATTGYSDEPVLALPREFGFDGALRKPFRLQDLAETLKSCEKGPIGTNGTAGENRESAGKGGRITTNRKEEKDNGREEAGFRESD